MKIAVIDGLGGGLGCQMIEELNKAFFDRIEIMALGTNAQATSRLIDAGADYGATGENAVIVNSRKVDIIIGPLGIVIPNALMGEMSAVMAEAVADSNARKLLLGIKQPHVEIIGTGDRSIGQMIADLIEKVREDLD